MKKYMITTLAALISFSCNSQENKEKKIEKKNQEELAEAPKGSWKVNKEFDEEGHLMRYDSIYTWSSGADLDELAALDKDSTLKSMQSRFYRSFSDFDFEREGFGDLFAEDSLFTKRFFNDDFFDSEFGKDFIDIESIRDRMERMQREFLERYRKDFETPEDGDSQE